MRIYRPASGYKYFNKLFALEQKWADLTPFQREIVRQMKAEPLLDAYWTWVEKLDPAAGSKLEGAVTYARNQKKYLNAFLVYGDKIFEKPGQGGTAGGNGGKPAEKGGKLPESRRESLILEIDSQLSCPKTALTSVGALFFASRNHRRPLNGGGAAWRALSQLNRKTPGKPRKNGNPGTFLDGRNGRGPLNSTPEVTAAVP